MSLKIMSCIVSQVGTNCYILVDENSKKAAVIDPGEYTRELENILKVQNITELEYIMLTHGHFDHIDGVSQLKENFGGNVVISAIDEAAFTDDSISLCAKHFSKAKHPENADITVCDGDKIQLGETCLTVLSTPGHTAGSVCYVTDGVMFSGDTLFAGSCGRTDFKTGNYKDMYASLQKLALLEGDYRVYCGHGPATALSFERENNPYMSR